MADLVLNQINKQYGDNQVLFDIDLRIPDGEFVVLVGPSGCGKSTLLRMIAGLEDISYGDLLIGGHRSNGVPPQRRNIAMVFQSYALFPHMTVRDNIAYGPKLRGEKPDEIAAKIERAAEILNLEPYLERYPRQLSGGQRQRVAMGRAVVREPSLFLFDEPLSNLDAQLRVQMRTEIKALHKKVGRTSIYVTHDQIEAMTLADRIVVMNGGHIEQIGTPLELYDRPETLFVASFIGSPSMNLLEATVASSDGGPVAVLDDTVSLPLPETVNAEVGETIKVGIRPENVELADFGAGLPLVVDLIEQTGADTYVYGKIAGQAVVALFRWRLEAESGSTLYVKPQAGKEHCFDLTTGKRI
ncbi:sn-glycerol-3-phosphate ABC transporter ATP-binding protein UgpC [Martelella sp. AD-3]|uniref:ABC transporter ATP-binding protein n=1 Tax=Martelella sp. AD-3 TaxID=686597 RepID=UPI000464A63A|nr:sn-glycerol-3-phosphate ABC transporter ATP-binding protein UgpC [Martelella sp. AD-3]AMM84906.1 ABC transporter [Martelella sp. AD-3]